VEMVGHALPALKWVCFCLAHSALTQNHQLQGGRGFAGF